MNLKLVMSFMTGELSIESNIEQQLNLVEAPVLGWAPGKQYE